MISDFNMINAILPFCGGRNSFWSSSDGRKCVNRFLSMVQSVDCIDRYIVMTQDPLGGEIAGKTNMAVMNIPPAGCSERPYTFEQVRSMAKKVKRRLPSADGALIFLDHRNLMLNPDIVERAISAHREKPAGCVVGLSPCKDHPCQYKSYFIFMGSIVTSFEGCVSRSEVPNSGGMFIQKETTCPLKGHGEMKIRMETEGSSLRISLRCGVIDGGGGISQIIPFDINGPKYDRKIEIYSESTETEIMLDIDSAELSGLVFIFTTSARHGEYDTVEIFSPSKASWKYDGSGDQVVQAETNEKIFGRQQFSAVYTFDGSLCLFCSNDLSEDRFPHIEPFVLAESCIVIDEVDYLYAEIIQQSKENTSL